MKKAWPLYIFWILLIVVPLVVPHKKAAPIKLASERIDSIQIEILKAAR